MNDTAIPWRQEMRELHNHHFDSTIWYDFKFRDGGDKTFSEMLKDRGANNCSSIGAGDWFGAEFEFTDYWRKPDCDGEVLAVYEKYRVFPKRP